MIIWLSFLQQSCYNKPIYDDLSCVISISELAHEFLSLCCLCPSDVVIPQSTRATPASINP